jgi:hypothetical protein
MLVNFFFFFLLAPHFKKKKEKEKQTDPSTVKSKKKKKNGLTLTVLLPQFNGSSVPHSVSRNFNASQSSSVSASAILF